MVLTRFLQTFLTLFVVVFSASGPAQASGLFEPGSVAQRSDLQPPAQADDPGSQWFLVEKGVRLHKFERGNPSGPATLVVHGGPCGATSEAWPGLEGLESERRIIYYHQRGCGLSDGEFTPDRQASYWKNMMRLDEKLGLSEQLADIERIRRIVEADQITLVGHSFGGFLAALYAAEFPGQVDKMVLVSPADMIATPEVDLYDLVEEYLPKAKRKGFRKLRQRVFDFENLFERSADELAAMQREFGNYYAIAQKAKFPGLEFPGGPRYEITWMPFAVYLGLGRNHDYTQHLSTVTVPSLVLHGTGDLQPASAGRSYVDVFEQSDFTTIPEASHFSFVENPQTFGRGVEDFLSR